MAETVMAAAAEILLENLSDLIKGESDLLVGIKDKVDWIESELVIMVSHLDSVDALHQLPENADGCMEATRSVIRQAENLIQTYVKRADESRMAPVYKKYVYWFIKRDLVKKLLSLKHRIINVKQMWELVDFKINSPQDRLAMDISLKIDPRPMEFSNLVALTLSEDQFRRHLRSIYLKMQVCLEGLSTADKVRLKPWVEEMKVIADEARAIQERGTVGLHGRFQHVKKINELNNHLAAVSEWKFACEIGDARSTKGSRYVDYSSLYGAFDTGSSSHRDDIQVGYQELPLLQPVELGEIQQENNRENSVEEPSASAHLRQCLYYFLLFPVNFEVPARRLIALWVAEGLVRPKNKYEPVEHVAESNLDELIRLNMVKVTKKKLNGKVISCKLSDGIRDTWLMKAKEAHFFTQPIARVVDHHGGSDSCFIQIHGNPNSSTSISDYQKAFSFLSFDSREGSKPGEDIGNFLDKSISTHRCFLELMFLDLEHVFRPKLTEALKILTRLKYLGLRWTYLEDLPEYISKLLNLEVLDVKHTYISTLPSSIWSMRYLRHLYLSEIFRTRFTGRPSKISLNDLQTLLGAYIDEDTPVSCGLDTAVNIRKLGLICRPSKSESSNMSGQLKAVDEWISKLHYLESLSLKSRDENGKPSDLHLTPFWFHPNLSDVYLLGKLQQSVVSRFPESLIDITLSGSELGKDPMESLGKLPNLRILKLYDKSLLVNKISCTSGSFPRLKILRIWNLEMLEDWEVEEGALTSLEDMEIRSCENLKTLPDGIKKMKKLEKLKLTNMPRRFVDETKEQNPELWIEVEEYDPDVGSAKD